MAINTTEEMSPQKALSNVQAFIIEQLKGKAVRIYEAGGGSISVIPLAAFDHPKVTAVDIDQVQLSNNKYANVKIHGDIQTHEFPEGSFELIVCHNVIEHLPILDKAIQKFHRALVPGGLLFIGAPNPESLFGFITKYTPHWFHVWAYRAILGDKDAGKPGRGPFRTYYHPLVSPKALRAFCSKNGLEVAYFNLFASKNLASLSESRPAVGKTLHFMTRLFDAMTLRKLDLIRGDYHIVLRKIGK
jgi:SAM-dependent methyltransferase